MKTSINLIIIFVVLSLGADAQNVPKPNITAPQGLSVNSFTGNLFYQRNEQSLRGTGFRIYQTFYYNAAQDTLDYGYGHGWSFYYNSFYTQNKDTVVIQHADAKKDIFLLKNGAYISPAGVFDVLTKSGMSFTLKSKDGQLQVFADPTHKKLTRMEDANGNYITIDYANGYPVNIKNSTGHNLALVWEKNLLKEAKDNDNPDKKYSYSYSADHDMIAATDPMGGKKTYTYKKHFLINVSDENGNPAGIDYLGNSGRVTRIITCSTDQRFTFLDSLHKTFVTQKGANGDITNGYFFDEKGRLTGLTDADNNKAEFTYDDDNNLTESKDFGEKNTLYAYDAHGNLVSQTDPAGNRIIFTYNDDNKPLTLKDARGGVSTFTYDIKGNLKTATKPGGATETYTYDAAGRRLTVTNANNGITRFQYNADGDLVKTEYPVGAVKYQYNGSCCNVGSITDANGNTLAMTYDLVGHTKTVKDSQGNTTTYDYDGAGNVTKETDPNGYTKQYMYDGLNRLAGVTISAGTWTYEYDAQGNLTKMTDANGHATTYAYNNKNQLTRETDPIGHGASYSYDLSGNLTQRRDPNGNIVNYKYDNLNRLVEKSYDGNTDKLSYDESGNIVSAYNNNIAYSFDYDSQNRLLKKNILTWDKSISYTYDAIGNRKTMTDQDGGVTTYEYDTNSRLITLKNAANLITRFEYDAGGRITKQVNGNGTFVTYHYDEAGRMDALTNWKNASEKISFFNYTFDKYGNRKTMTDKRGLHTYTYDAANRLTAVTYADGTTESFKIDGTGNRTQRTKNGIPTAYTYNSADQVQTAGPSSYVFDANGNTIQQNDSLKRVYKYDGENRLLQVQLDAKHNVQYKYDPFGDKIEKQDTSASIIKMVYDGDNLLGELNFKNETQTAYTNALTADIELSVTSKNDTYFYSKDGLNSVTELTNSIGSILGQYQYDVYGSIVLKNESIKNSVLYTGRLYDKESQLYDYRSRHYNSTIGRFVNEDYFKGSLSTPTSINKYTYTENNPVLYIDPFGSRTTTIGINFGLPFFTGSYSINYDNSWNFAIHKSIGGGFSTSGGIGPFVTVTNAPNIFDLEHNGKSYGLTGGEILTVDIGRTEGTNYTGTTFGFGLGLDIPALAPPVPISPYYFKTYTTCVFGNCSDHNDFEKGTDDPIPAPPGQGQTIKFPVLIPKDPNEIVGTAGFDTTKKWVSAKQSLQYKILFENDPEFATAAARRVTVYSPIDEKINASSLRLSDFGFGNFNFTIPPNTSVYTNRLDLRDSLGMFVDITAGLDVTNRRAFWIFDSIDPATGLAATLPPEKGFLPVNDTISHKGEGYVNFTVVPLPTTKTQDTVTANATILFDDEGTLSTNTWKNTVDAVAPASKISTYTTNGADIALNWAGQDDAGGTGIKDYALYVAENKGAYQLQEAHLIGTKYTFNGTAGSQYDFFVIATDRVGNTEALKSKPDVSVTAGKPKTSQTITFKPFTPVTYGDTDFALTASASSALPLSYISDNPAIAAITAGNKLHIVKAGAVTITASQPGNDTFQPTPSIGQPLTINKKELTVSANDNTKLEGEANPVLTINYSGFVNGDDETKLTIKPLPSTTATTASPPGIYPITIKDGIADNYTFKYVEGKLTVSKPLAPLVFAGIPTKTYGDPDFNLGASSGYGDIKYTLSNAGVLDNLSSGKVHVSGAGTVTVTATDGKTTLAQTVTINKAVLKVTATDATRKYNEENPGFLLTYTGFVNGDNSTAVGNKPTAVTTAVKTSDAGSYPITLSGGASTNYILTLVNGTLTITKLDQTLSFAVLPAKTYGDAPFIPVSFATSGLPVTFVSSNPAVASIVSDRIHILKAGTAVISATQEGNGGYSKVDAIQRNLLIGKAKLNAKADDKARPYGANNPPFTISFTGFVNGDGPDKLERAPQLETTAVLASGIGVYPIIAGKAISSNYEITYADGKLTITPAIRTLEFNDLVKTYGDADFNPGATINTNEPIVYGSSNINVAAINNGQIHINGTGLSQITASVVENNNYSGPNSVSKQLTVNKAPQTIIFGTIPLLQRRGDAYVLQVSSSSGLPVELVLSDKFIATLNGTSLQPLSIGTGKVRATQEGDSNYLPATEVIRDFRVTDASGANIQVRQAVSADGDGINDFLVIEGINDFPKNHLVIVNRNGSKIFEAVNYDNQSHVFDGRNANGEKFQAGTYYYVLTYRSGDAEQRQTGYFILKY